MELQDMKMTRNIIQSARMWEWNRA